MNRPLPYALAALFLALNLRADPAPEPAAKDELKPEAEPALSVTAHSVTVNGKVLNYHATAGYMVLKEEEGKPLVPAEAGAAPAAGDKAQGDSKADDDKFKNGVKPTARVFFVAYTLDEATDPASRPITYLFNGGPGSSSMWLHMGAVAPRRAVLSDDGESPPPPYRIADNAETWLDHTDLVFIDPVSTGFSRAWPKEDPKQFYGLKEDIASIGDFIRLYTSRNGRWLSPKFILGESYGTTRAAGLSDYLQDRYGLYLNGLILVSSAMNYKVFIFSPQNLEPYVDFLPTYAAAAWYHQKLPADLQAKDLPALMDEVKAFAENDYAFALRRGDALPSTEKQRISARLSRYTGIPASEFLLLKLRMKDVTFSDQLLHTEGRYLGRYDSRFTGPSYAPGETQDDEYDPSAEALEAPFSAAFNDYVRRELKYESDLPYEDLADVDPWNFGDAENGFPNTAEDLRRAMTRNPYLKVWLACGYFDLATPFFGSENVVASMDLDASVRGNLRFTYYRSGHMVYVHTPSRVQFKADFLAFLKDATSQATVRTASRVPATP